jgi:hypothetical protein
MKDSPQMQPRIFTGKVWPLLMLALGLSRLADWWPGNGRDPTPLLAGVGFLLLAAGTVARSSVLRSAGSVARQRLGLALALLGLALVLASIAMRDFGRLPIG